MEEPAGTAPTLDPGADPDLVLPWERQPGESAIAYEAFQVYRDMSYGRSITAAADQLDKARRVLADWSSEHNWVARCRAFDAETERLVSIEAIEGIVAMRKTHLQMAQALMTKAAQRVLGDRDNGIEALDVKEMTPNDVVRFVETAAKLERLARGDVTERVDVGVGPGSDDARIDVRSLVDGDPALALELRDVVAKLQDRKVVDTTARELVAGGDDDE